jgi:hypothetical protein
MKIAIILAVLIIGSPALAGNNLKTVDKILSTDGITHKLRQWKPEFEKVVFEKIAGESLDAATGAKIKKLGRRIYTTNNLKEIYRLAFSKQLTEEDIKNISTWQSSPIGKKISKKISLIYRKNTLNKSERYLTQHPMDKNRSNIIRSCFRSSGFSKLNSETIFSAILGVAFTQNGYQSKSKKIKPVILKKIAENESLVRGKSSSKQLLKKFAYAFRELDDKEIDSFRTFSESRYGQNFLKAHYKATKITGEKAAQTAMKAAESGM